MERSPVGLAQFEVDGGYLPGGDDSAELSGWLTPLETPYHAAHPLEQPEDEVDASIFAAMIHP